MIWLVGLLSLFGDPGAWSSQDPQSLSEEEAKKAIQRRDYDAVEAMARRAIQKDANDPLGWFYLGYARASRGDFAFASGAYAECLRHGLQDFQVYYQMGYCAHREARYGVAEQHLAKALELRPGDPDALYYLGVSRYELKKDKEAEGTLTTLLASPSPWDELGHLYRGLARWRLGEHKGSHDDFDWVEKNGKEPALKAWANKMLTLEQSPAAQGPSQGPSAPLPAPPPTLENKRWSVSLYEKGGYDTNVLLLPQTSLATKSGEGALFLMSFASGSYELVEPGHLTARLSLLDLSYSRLHQSDFDGVLSSVETLEPISQTVRFKGAVVGEFYALDRKPFFLHGGATAALVVTPKATLRFEGGGLVMAKDFHEQALETLNATELGGFFEGSIRDLWGPWSRAALRYELLDEDASAAVQSYLQHRLWGTLEFSITSALSLKVEGGLRWQLYARFDPFLGTTRNDRNLKGQITPSYRLTDSIQIFGEVQAERNQSNAPMFQYRRQSYALGVFLFW
jgi:hypothetical protein